MVERFKVGDLIKGTNHEYGITDSNMTLAEVVSVDKRYNTDFMRIRCLKFRNGYKTDTIFDVLNDPTMFALVSRPDDSKIIIYVDGKDVIAKNIKTGKIGKATCHPDDEFDFAIGAKLAFERLMRRVVKQDSYEVGDKVKIVDKWNEKTNQNHDGEMDKYLGTVMTIESSTRLEMYQMEEDKSENDGLGWFWNKHCIEGKVVDDSIEPKKKEPKFKPGDIVELLEKHGSIPKGTRGELVKCDLYDLYLIDFKFDYGCTHTNEGDLPKPTGRLVGECFFKKVDA